MRKKEKTTTFSLYYCVHLRMKNKTTIIYEKLTFQVKYIIFHIGGSEIELMKHLLEEI